MRKVATSVLLYFVVMTSLMAQGQLPEMGLALRSEGTGQRIFATHRDHPFGTRLKITNLVNNMDLEVTVEGTPRHPRALIEVSSLASDFLGIPGGVLNQVFIEILFVPTPEPAMRARVGSFLQTGNATVMGNRTDLSASHPSIPLGREVDLTNTANGRRVTVTVTGRIDN